MTRRAVEGKDIGDPVAFAGRKAGGVNEAQVRVAIFFTDFPVTQLIMAEAWWLTSRRAGLQLDDRVWEVMLSGVFQVLDLDVIDLAAAAVSNAAWLRVKEPSVKLRIIGEGN